MSYGYRVEGPWQPEAGHRFDPSKLLLDPCADSLTGTFTYDPALSEFGTDTTALVPKSVLVHPLPALEPRTLRKPEAIYEINIRAFSMRHPDVPEHLRGTLGALGHSSILDYLVKLQIDTVELMPVTAWIDERHLVKAGLRNAWGYNPVSFFAPDPRIIPGGMMELRSTVAALHAAGINVVLDLVFNHSGESDQFGPTVSFRGLDSTSYYAHHGGVLINDTGCGNTFALYEPHLVQHVVDSLRHWVLQCGIDGFRFDLATIMGRLPDGFSLTRSIA